MADESFNDQCGEPDADFFDTFFDDGVLETIGEILAVKKSDDDSSCEAVEDFIGNSSDKMESLKSNSILKPEKPIQLKDGCTKLCQTEKELIVSTAANSKDLRKFLGDANEIKEKPVQKKSQNEKIILHQNKSVFQDRSSQPCGKEKIIVISPAHIHDKEDHLGDKSKLKELNSSVPTGLRNESSTSPNIVQINSMKHNVSESHFPSEINSHTNGYGANMPKKESKSKRDPSSPAMARNLDNAQKESLNMVELLAKVSKFLKGSPESDVKGPEHPSIELDNIGNSADTKKCADKPISQEGKGEKLSETDLQDGQDMSKSSSHVQEEGLKELSVSVQKCSDLQVLELKVESGDRQDFSGGSEKSRKKSSTESITKVSSQNSKLSKNVDCACVNSETQEEMEEGELESTAAEKENELSLEDTGLTRINLKSSPGTKNKIQINLKSQLLASTTIFNADLSSKSTKLSNNSKKVERSPSRRFLSKSKNMYSSISSFSDDSDSSSSERRVEKKRRKRRQSSSTDEVTSSDQEKVKHRKRKKSKERSRKKKKRDFSPLSRKRRRNSKDSKRRKSQSRSPLTFYSSKKKRRREMSPQRSSRRKRRRSITRSPSPSITRNLRRPSPLLRRRSSRSRSPGLRRKQESPIPSSRRRRNSRSKSRSPFINEISRLKKLWEQEDEAKRSSSSHAQPSMPGNGSWPNEAVASTSTTVVTVESVQMHSASFSFDSSAPPPGYQSVPPPLMQPNFPIPYGTHFLPHQFNTFNNGCAFGLPMPNGYIPLPGIPGVAPVPPVPVRQNLAAVEVIELESHDLQSPAPQLALPAPPAVQSETSKSIPLAPAESQTSVLRKQLDILKSVASCLEPLPQSSICDVSSPKSSPEEGSAKLGHEQDISDNQDSENISTLETSHGKQSSEVLSTTATSTCAARNIGLTTSAIENAAQDEENSKDNGNQSLINNLSIEKCPQPSTEIEKSCEESEVVMAAPNPSPNSPGGPNINYTPEAETSTPQLLEENNDGAQDIVEPDLGIIFEGVPPKPPVELICLSDEDVDVLYDLSTELDKIDKDTNKSHSSKRTKEKKHQNDGDGTRRGRRRNRKKTKSKSSPKSYHLVDVRRVDRDSDTKKTGDDVQRLPQNSEDPIVKECLGMIDSLRVGRFVLINEDPEEDPTDTIDNPTSNSLLLKKRKVELLFSKQPSLDVMPKTKTIATNTPIRLLIDVCTGTDCSQRHTMTQTDLGCLECVDHKDLILNMSSQIQALEKERDQLLAIVRNLDRAQAIPGLRKSNTSSS